MGDLVHMDPQIRAIRRASKAVAAQVMRVSVNTIDAWLRRGAPFVERGTNGKPWVIDCLELMKWRYSQDTIEHRPALDPEEMTPIERRNWYQSENLRRQAEESLAKLVPVEPARREAKILVAIVSEHLSAITNYIAVNYGEEAKAMVQSRIESAISHAQQRLDALTVEREPRQPDSSDDT